MDFDKAKRRVERAVVGLLVQGPDPKISHYLYTGFVVNLNSTWTWVTAAHVLDTIESALQTGSKLRYQFVVQSATGWRSIPVPFEQYPRLNCIDRARDHIDDLSDDHPNKSKDPETFDLGFVELDSLASAYLIEAGVKPFHSAEVSPTAKDQAAVLSKPFTLVVIGFPSSQVEPIGDDFLKGTLKVFPIEPGTVDPPTILVNPTWDRCQFDGSLDGVSGGPVCLLSEENAFLLGVQVGEISTGPRTDKLKIVETLSLYGAIVKNATLAA